MVYEAANISQLESFDTNADTIAFLTEEGRAGTWLARQKIGYAALLSADVSGGLVKQSLFDIDKALVRHFDGFVDPAWWGVKPSNTASVNNALLQECLNTVALCAERTVRFSANSHDLTGGLFIPPHVELRGTGACMAGDAMTPPPSRLHFATSSYCIEIGSYAKVDGLAFYPASGYSPGAAMRAGGSGANFGSNAIIGGFAVGIFVGNPNTALNLNHARIEGGFIKNAAKGVIVQQYRTPAPPQFTWGACDVNRGFLGPIRVYYTTGVGIGFYNAGAWDFANPLVDRCDTGFVFDHQCIGNKGMAYAESNGLDVFVGSDCRANEIDFTPYPGFLTTNYAGAAKALNTIRSRAADASGNVLWKVA